MSTQLPLGEPLFTFKIVEGQKVTLSEPAKGESYLLQFNTKDTLAQIQFPMKGKELELDITYDGLHKHLPEHWNINVGAIPLFTELRVFKNPYPTE